MDSHSETGVDVVVAALQLVRLRSRARSAAFFVPRADALWLVASDGIDGTSLADVGRIWSAPPVQTRRGALYQGVSARSFVVVPAMRVGQLVGLIYLELGDAGEAFSAELMRLVADLMADAIGAGTAAQRADGTSTSDPVAEATKANLLFLLEREEGNVARAARVLGVTRSTVYNRLQRHGVKARHIKQAGRRPPR